MYKFMHFRTEGLELDSISSKGGATAAYVEKGGKIYAAFAFCNPDDNFNFRYGRAKAKGRLVQLQKKPELVDDHKYHIIDKDELGDRTLVEEFLKRLGDNGYFDLFHPGTGLWA